MRYWLITSQGNLSPRTRRERGAELLEGAVVLPIILILLLGLVVFARGWNIYQTMTRAAREGVRQSITTSCATCGGTFYADSHIENDVVFPVLKAGGVNTSNPLLNSSYVQGYTWLDENRDVCGTYITFKYPYKVSIPFIPMNLGTVDLNTYVQMRFETEVGNCPP